MSLSPVDSHSRASQLRGSSLRSLSRLLRLQMRSLDETTHDTIAGLPHQASLNRVTASVTSLVAPPKSQGRPSPLSTHRPPRPPSLHSHRVSQTSRWHNP
jgi:hypothetical protein